MVMEVGIYNDTTVSKFALTKLTKYITGNRHELSGIYCSFPMTRLARFPLVTLLTEGAPYNTLQYFLFIV